MQKINFLPQVKAWNAIEFGPKHTWTLGTNDVGLMTYDPGTDRKDSFKVSMYDGSTNAQWLTVLTSGDNSDYVSQFSIYNDTDQSHIDMTGDVSIRTRSKYIPDVSNDKYNPFATIADIKYFVDNGYVLDVKMDGNSVIDSSIAYLYSDTSHPYDASTNPLATMGTVQQAIQDIANVLTLREVYTKPYEAGTQETPNTIYELEDLLAYFNTDGSIGVAHNLHDASGNWDVERGDVVLFGNEEWVYYEPEIGSGEDYEPWLISNWELFGKLDVDTTVTSFGGMVGAISIDSSSFYMDSSTLKLYRASDVSLGGILTGFSNEAVTEDEETIAYRFGLEISGTQERNGRTYTEIPVQDGSSAVPGLITMDDYNTFIDASNGAKIYKAVIDPSTLGLTMAQYATTESVTIQHNLGTEDLIVNVYKNDASSAYKRHAVYVDEIITDASTLDIHFGSYAAFIGCQDSSVINNETVYYGYTVVFSATPTPTSIPDASITGHWIIV